MYVYSQANPIKCFLGTEHSPYSEMLWTRSASEILHYSVSCLSADFNTYRCRTNTWATSEDLPGVRQKTFLVHASNFWSHLEEWGRHKQPLEEWVQPPDKKLQCCTPSPQQVSSSVELDILGCVCVLEQIPCGD